MSATILAGCGGAQQSAAPLPAVAPMADREASSPLQSSAAGSTSSTSATAASVADSSNFSPGTLATTGNVATYAGCNIFTAGDYYNADITSSSIDAHSSSYVSSVLATDNTGFYASYGPHQVNKASSSTTLYTVKQKVSYHAFPVKYPWQSGYFIEPGGGDAHAIVLLATPPHCHLYELYQTTFSGNVLSAYSGADWDLTQPFKTFAPSAMASGLSLFAGMVKYEEIATGIHHALNFGLWQGTPCSCYVAPAGSFGSSYTGPSATYKLPWGAHVRLKASFDDSHFGPQSKAIAEALKHYGAFMSDTGGHYTNNNAFYMANPTSGGAWNSSDLAALHGITFSNFDVLPVGTIK